MDCILADAGISLWKPRTSAEVVTHGDSSFIESPEVGDNLTAHRERERERETLRERP